MPVYQYKGLRPDGRAAVGVIDADSAKGARLKLRQDGVFPTELAEAEPRGDAVAGAGGSHRTPAITGQDLANLTRQLSTLLLAGLPLVDALAILIEQSDPKPVRALLADLRDQIRQGKSLSQALATHPGSVPSVFIHMVQAGEASGALDHILVQVADFLDAHVALKQKVTNAAVYPALMLLVSVGVLVFLLTFVVPKITAVFADVHQILPWPTRALMAISGFLGASWWLLLIAAVTALAATRRWLGTSAGRMRADRALLRLPIVGLLVRKIAVARLSSTLATMLASGVPLLDALEVAKRVMNNAVLEAAVESARRNIREGEGIAEPLKRSGEFPALVTHMITVGERSGELEDMLRRVAHIYTRDVDRLMTRLASLLEPVMILGMGVIVFFIVLAILLPIFEMSHMVK